MLTQLSIKGLAIIGNISIDFSERLNVITGETGAGKSILIKALGLLCGRKASADIVRKGDPFAQVTGIFDVNPSHKVSMVLEESGLASEIAANEGVLIIRRQISARGRSSSWVNDIPVTLQVLKRIGESLVDILSQHENHRLLDTSQHLAYLDQFLPNAKSLSRYEAHYEAAHAHMKKLREILSQLEIKMREKDYLLFRHAEFAKLAPSCDDFQAVESYVRDAGQLEKNRKLLLSAQAIIDEGYKSRILSEAFSEVRRILGAWNTPTLKNDVEEILDLLGIAESSVNDLSFGLGKCVSALDVDEYQLKEAQERLGAYRDLMRKLSVQDVSQLVEEGQKLNSELAFIDSGEELVDQLLETLHKECQALRLSARELSSARRRAFQKVKKSIQKELHELNMKGAKLDLAWLQVSHSIDGIKLQYLSNQQSSKLNDCLDILCAHNRSGAEKVQFILSSNPGESAKPLSKIASGGEISRIMLGIKSVLSAGADTCLMVFDEIDTGISGQTADIVGGKLKAMASRFQVLCISHLPQVAAYANTHFKVEKLTRSGRTESIIKALTKSQGMREVARLLSGEEITKPSLDNAKQLINNAKKS